jgi:EAL domain-containing protein (putative c-di-GMP-specific phosphodiesterase class I)
MYRAKDNGRNGAEFSTKEINARVRQSMELGNELRGALARAEFSVHYQPKANIVHGGVIGFEALLRWNNPRLGAVSPSDFVPLLEEHGLIVEVGEWVLREACRCAAAWPQKLTVAVNVSPVQLLSPRLAETAPAIAREAGLAPQRLELEITESTFLRDTRATMEVLHALRRAGLRIALDDFGTGYSALGYLRRFPFDRLKIDRSFVRELMTRADARAIVRTILGLTRTLRMQALAEGVEEPAHASLLDRYGCNALQGHLVSRPLEADRVAAFLTSWRPDRRPVWQVELPSTASMPL